jgi:hypothetical protein
MSKESAWGLLHAQCNRIVGYVENQRNKIDKALKYLEV